MTDPTEQEVGEALEWADGRAVYSDAASHSARTLSRAIRQRDERIKELEAKESGMDMVLSAGRDEIERADRAEARIKELQEALRVQFEKTSEAEARVKSLEAEADSCTIFVGKMEAERDTLRVEIEFLRDALKPAVRPDVHALVTKERDTLGADSRILLARAKELEDYILTKGIPDAPCPICHYNGNGYYTELMHDCVKRHKALTPAYGDQP